MGQESSWSGWVRCGGTGSIGSLTQWVNGVDVAAAVARIQPPTLELPCASGVAIKTNQPTNQQPCSSCHPGCSSFLPLPAQPSFTPSSHAPPLHPALQIPILESIPPNPCPPPRGGKFQSLHGLSPLFLTPALRSVRTVHKPISLRSELRLREAE